MRLEIRSRNIAFSDALRRHALRQIRLALSRFGGRVTRVRVRLEDVNGPKGGPDKLCRVAVGLVPGREAIVTSQEVDAYGAIPRAAERAARAVERALARNPWDARSLLRGLH